MIFICLGFGYSLEDVLTMDHDNFTELNLIMLFLSRDDFCINLQMQTGTVFSFVEKVFFPTKTCKHA